jgi:outer membrane protein insertion porin family
MREAGRLETLSLDLSLNRAGEQKSRRAVEQKPLIKNKLFSIFNYCSAGLLLFCAIFCSSVPAAGEPLRIQHIEVAGLYSISEEELLYLLTLETDKMLDREALNRGIKRAFLKGIFDDIIIERIDLHDAAIRVTVREKPVIGSIIIQGNEYLPDRFIRKHLAIAKGERFNALKIRQSLMSIEKALKQKGFADPSVSYNLIHKDNIIDIVFEVIEGKPDIIKQIIVHEPENVVRQFLRLSEGDILDRSEMDRLIRVVKEYYERRGYIQTHLEYSFKDGVLDIRLDKGKMLIIDFEGNLALSSKSLMEEVPFFEIGAYSDELLEETAARIIKLYHRHGYPFAQIAPVVSISPEEIYIRFFIFEGDRYIVDSIAFERVPDADIAIPEERLKNILILKAGEAYNPSLLESDRANIEALYRAIGYLYAEVLEPVVEVINNSVKIRFQIKEGPRIMLSDIFIEGNKHITDEEILLEIPLIKGSPYNEVDVSDARRMILRLYNNRGFLNAKVSIITDISETLADVTFEIIEGDVTLFGKAVIRGNDRTKHRVIKRELLLEESKPLNYGLLFEERHRLHRLGLFTAVDVELLEKANNKRDILYSLEEAMAGAVEFGFGYGEYEKFRGFFYISHRNLWGMHRYGSFRTELSTLQQRFTLSYSEPWFMNKEDLIFNASLLHEHRTEKNIDTGEVRYRLRRNTASAGIEKRFNDAFQADLYYDFSVVKTYDIKPDIILSREDIGTLRISGIRPSLLYDTRDNPLDPRSGFVVGSSLKLASSVFLSETEFAKLTLYAHQYHSLSRRIVLAVSARGGAAQGFGDTRELPIVERFFLGGGTTVRGYAQDTLGPRGVDGTPTGGNVFLMGNLELRFDVGRGFGIVTFVDGGNVWRKLENVDIKNFKFTTGIGLRYSTPIGPLSLDYGYKLDREPGENKGALHFSIGHAF